MGAVSVWTGHEVRALRIGLRMTIEAFAEHLGVAVRTVAKWEARGSTIVPVPLIQEVLDTALERATPTQQSRFEILRAEGRPPSVGSGVAGESRKSNGLDGIANECGVIRPLLLAEWTPERATSVLEIATSDDASQTTPALALRLAHEWLVTEPPQIQETRAGRQIGEGLIRTIERRVEQLRHMDDFIGGNDLHELVMKELRVTISILRGGGYSEALGKRLLTTVGELCQLAGWTAADAGLTSIAERCYAAGIHAAHEADNVPLAANLISSLSYLCSNVGNLGEAVLLAHTASVGAQHRASATTQALLQERIAWAHARAGELRQTQRALGEAELAYEQRNPDDDPAWVYWLNHDEIDVMAGRCYTELHQPRQAEPLLRSALDRYDEDLVRETLLYASWLAECYVQTEDIDQAAAQATRALILSTRVRSARAKERIQLLRQRLAAAPRVRAVREFEELCRDQAACCDDVGLSGPSSS